MARNRISLANMLNCGITCNKRAAFIIEYAKDFDARRAAVASGYAADYGYKLRDSEDIQRAINKILEYRLEYSHIDAEWLLMEAVDNHLIARQSGNISASNTALNLIAKHAAVDAFAAEKVEVLGDEAVKERLLRGRKRMQGKENNNDQDDLTFI